MRSKRVGCVYTGRCGLHARRRVCLYTVCGFCVFAPLARSAKRKAPKAVPVAHDQTPLERDGGVTERVECVQSPILLRAHTRGLCINAGPRDVNRYPEDHGGLGLSRGLSTWHGPLHASSAVAYGLSLYSRPLIEDLRTCAGLLVSPQSGGPAASCRTWESPLV